jgi:hypothetical protein
MAIDIVFSSEQLGGNVVCRCRHRRSTSLGRKQIAQVRIGLRCLGEQLDVFRQEEHSRATCLHGLVRRPDERRHEAATKGGGDRYDELS